MSDDTLRGVLRRVPLGSLTRGDFLIGVVFGIGGGVLAAERPATIAPAAGVVAGLAGVVIGAVIAAVTLAGAFLNPAFLRKMRAIEEDPVDSLAPLFITGILATIAALLALVASVSPATAPAWWLIPLFSLLGLSSAWALASMIPNLTNVIRFIRLQQDAAEVPDDAVPPQGERK